MARRISSAVVTMMLSRAVLDPKASCPVLTPPIARPDIQIRGPRIWMSGRAIGGVSTGHDAFGSRTARDNIIVTTPDEVRRAIQRKKDFGCEILKVNEFLSMDLLKLACDEAHRLGM